jgi:hypothetical protein
LKTWKAHQEQRKKRKQSAVHDLIVYLQSIKGKAAELYIVRLPLDNITQAVLSSFRCVITPLK